MFKKYALLALILPLCLTLTSCANAPVDSGVDSVNAHLFKDPDDLKARSALLTPGMTEVQVFEALGISSDSPNLFELRGDSVLEIVRNGGPENVRSGVRYKGFELPYSVLEKKGYFQGMQIKEKREGFKLWLVLVFRESADNAGVTELYNASIYGARSVLEYDSDSIIWELLRDIPSSIPKMVF